MWEIADQPKFSSPANRWRFNHWDWTALEDQFIPIHCATSFLSGAQEPCSRPEERALTCLKLQVESKWWNLWDDPCRPTDPNARRASRWEQWATCRWQSGAELRGTGGPVTALKGAEVTQHQPVTAVWGNETKVSKSCDFFSRDPGNLNFYHVISTCLSFLKIKVKTTTTK